jgi:hypothetical protein
VTPPAPPDGPDEVHTWPHLLRIEAKVAALVLAVLLGWALRADAPLGPEATLPAPAGAAPWFLAGLQALAEAAGLGGAWVALGVLAVVGLVVIPYVDPGRTGSGAYALRTRRFAAATFLGGFIGLGILPLVLAAFHPVAATAGEPPGVLAVAGAMVWTLLLPALAWRLRGGRSPSLRALGPVRFALAAVLFQAMTGLVLAVVGRLFLKR